MQTRPGHTSVQARPVSGAGTAPRSSALRACHSVPASNGGQELYLAAREDRNREDVTIEHAVARERCEPRPGRQNATRLSGSAPDSDTRSPEPCLRSMPTASGSACCLPEKPATKRPRIFRRAVDARTRPIVSTFGELMIG
jgi:hypothetical protein